MKQKDNAIPFSGYQKFMIAILAFIQFTVVLDFMIISPIGDILMKSLELTPKQFSIVVASYAFSAAVSGIVSAGFADKFDRKKFLMFFYAGFLVGTLFCGISTNYYGLLASRIVTGIFGGVISSISMAIMTDIFAVQQRGRVMGMVQMAFAAAQILGIPIGIYLADKFNWHVSFLMIVAVSLVVGMIILFKMKPITEHLKLQTDRSAFQHLVHTIKKKNYQVVFLATAMLSIGGFMLMPFGNAFLVNNVHIPQSKLSLIAFCTGISAAIVMPLIGKLSDKVDKFKLFTGASIWAIVMVIVYTNIPIIPVWQVIIINMLLFMGIMGRVVPSSILTTAVPEMKDRGAFMSFNSSLQYMAGGVSALVAGLIVRQETKKSPIEHYDILGYVVAGVIVVCIYLMYRVSVLVKSKAAQSVPTTEKPKEELSEVEAK
jgi:predicted MFS family arabinose efflux permease